MERESVISKSLTRLAEAREKSAGELLKNMEQGSFPYLLVVDTKTGVASFLLDPDVREILDSKGERIVHAMSAWANTEGASLEEVNEGVKRALDSYEDYLTRVMRGRISRDEAIKEDKEKFNSYEPGRVIVIGKTVTSRTGVESEGLSIGFLYEKVAEEIDPNFLPKFKKMMQEI